MKCALGFLVLLLCVLLFSGKSHAEPLSVAQEEVYANSKAYIQLKQFVRETLARANIQVEYVSLPLTRANVMTSSGEIDAQLIRAPTVLSEFPKLRATRFPIFYTNVRFFYLKSFQSFDEQHLQKYRGVGPLNNQGLIAEVRKENLQLVEIRQLEQAVNLLRTQRADYILLPEEIIHSLLMKDPVLEKEVKVSERIFVRFPLYFIVSSKKAYLLSKIEKAFRGELTKDHSRFPLIKGSLNSNP